MEKESFSKQVIFTTVAETFDLNKSVTDGSVVNGLLRQFKATNDPAGKVQIYEAIADYYRAKITKPSLLDGKINELKNALVNPQMILSEIVYLSGTQNALRFDVLPSDMPLEIISNNLIGDLSLLMDLLKLGTGDICAGNCYIVIGDFVQIYDDCGHHIVITLKNAISAFNDAIRPYVI